MVKRLLFSKYLTQLRIFNPFKNLCDILSFEVFYVENSDVDLILDGIFLIIFLEDNLPIPFEYELRGNPASSQSDDFVHLDAEQSASWTLKDCPDNIEMFFVNPELVGLEIIFVSSNHINWTALPDCFMDFAQVIGNSLEHDDRPLRFLEVDIKS